MSQKRNLLECQFCGAEDATPGHLLPLLRWVILVAFDVALVALAGLVVFCFYMAVTA